MDIVDVVHLKEQYTLKLEPCRATDPTSDQTVQVFSPESREGDCISKQSQDVHSYFDDSFSRYGEKGTTVFDTPHSGRCNTGGLPFTKSLQKHFMQQPQYIFHFPARDCPAGNLKHINF